MSTAAGAPSNGTSAALKSPEKNKGKGKSTAGSPDVSMQGGEEAEEDEDEDEDEEEEDEEDEEEEEEEDEEMGEYDGCEEINTVHIVDRRTRGVKVDYTSKEALEKAGLKAENEDDGDEDK